VDKVVTTTLLIIAGVVCSIFLFNSVFPVLNRSSEAMISMTDKIDERMKSRISVLHVASEPDRKTIYVWVKNIGSSRILGVNGSDLFFGKEGNFMRVPHAGDAAGANPSWDYTIENDTEWAVNATLKITITYDSDPGAGTYFVKFVIPNGIMDEYYFSM
jgi:archaellum component FlaF (FlaF/FlaG flagellin family)